MERSTKSILEMARGAILERVDYEMAKILDNILDANTKATAKRKMTLTLYLTGQEGSAQAVEMVPQVPGQTSLDLEEQEVPSELKIIRFA